MIMICGGVAEGETATGSCSLSLLSAALLVRLATLAVLGLPAASAPEWRNGRRSRLKPGGRKAWGFESLLRHQLSAQICLG